MENFLGTDVYRYSIVLECWIEQIRTEQVPFMEREVVDLFLTYKKAAVRQQCKRK